MGGSSGLLQDASPRPGQRGLGGGDAADPEGAEQKRHDSARLDRPAFLLGTVAVGGQAAAALPSLGSRQQARVPSR